MNKEFVRQVFDRYRLGLGGFWVREDLESMGIACQSAYLRVSSCMVQLSCLAFNRNRGSSFKSAFGRGIKHLLGKPPSGHQSIASCSLEVALRSRIARTSDDGALRSRRKASRRERREEVGQWLLHLPEHR